MTCAFSFSVPYFRLLLDVANDQKLAFSEQRISNIRVGRGGGVMPPENSRLRCAILNVLANEPNGAKPSQIISLLDQSLAPYALEELDKMVANGCVNEALCDYCLPEFFKGMVQRKIAMLQATSNTFLETENGDENFNRNWEYLEGRLEDILKPSKNNCPKN